MKDLVYKSDKGNPVTTSLLVAEKFGKRHADVLRAIDNLGCSDDFNQCNFAFVENQLVGASKERYCIMTRDGFTFLAMGFTGERAAKFKEEYINAFNQMEVRLKELTSSQFLIPQNFADALRLAAVQAEENERLSKQIEDQAPAVLFKQSVEGASTNVSVEYMSKILNQNGIDIGQNRLYDWLVDNKYLIRHKRWSKKKEKYINDYTQTQKAADMKVFFITETVINPSGVDPFIKHTVKVTGKGQVYFVNKFLNNNLL